MMKRSSKRDIQHIVYTRFNLEGMCSIVSASLIFYRFRTYFRELLRKQEIH